VGGFWMLFLDSFKRQVAEEQQQAGQPFQPQGPTAAPPLSPLADQPETFRQKVMRFIRERGEPDDPLP
jgi:hypothetical protein